MPKYVHDCPIICNNAVIYDAIINVVHVPQKGADGKHLYRDAQAETDHKVMHETKAEEVQLMIHNNNGSGKYRRVDLNVESLRRLLKSCDDLSGQPAPDDCPF